MQARRDRARRAPAVRRRELRRRRLPGRRAPLRRRARRASRRWPASPATASSSATTRSSARPPRRPTASATRATSATTRRREWESFFELAGLEVVEREAIERPLEIQPWLDRAGTPPGDQERVRELLGDRVADGLDAAADARAHAGREARPSGDHRRQRHAARRRRACTGSEGRFHGLRNRAYGTNVVAGVTPGKGGQDVEGIPVFDTVADAGRQGRRERVADLRAGPLRRRRDLRGGRRRHRRPSSASPSTCPPTRCSARTRTSARRA